MSGKNIPFFSPNYSHFQPQPHHNGTNGGGLFTSLNLSGSNGGFVNYVNGLGGGGGGQMGVGLNSSGQFQGMMNGSGTPPQLQMSPTSVLSNYSLSRNLNHLNLNLVPRTNR